MRSVDIEGLKKIGEGRYREVYRLDDVRCVKVLKPHVVKRYGPLSVRYPVETYMRFKFGILDFNAYEQQAYHFLTRTISPDLHPYIANVRELVTVKGRSATVSDLIANCDGSISKTLEQSGKVRDFRFWDIFSELEESLVGLEVPFFGIQGNNIMVRKSRFGDEPVLVDLKRMGYRVLPFQAWLRFGNNAERKIRRNFESLRQRHHAD